MTNGETGDYEVKDIVRRNGGVSVIIHLTSLDKDVYMTMSEDSFNKKTEYELKRQIEQVARRYLATPPKEGEVDKVEEMKKKFVGPQKLTH